MNNSNVVFRIYFKNRSWISVNLQEGCAAEIIAHWVHYLESQEESECLLHVWDASTDHHFLASEILRVEVEK